MPESTRVIPIYILAGQSNAQRMGIDAALVAALSEISPAFELIKYAVGATPLARSGGIDWNVNSTNELYDGLLAMVRDRIAYVVERGYIPQIAGVVWIQGEDDAAYDFRANQYFQNLSDLIAHLRLDLGTDMPFIISELSVTSDEPFNAAVREAQVRAAASIAGVTLVNTDDLTLQAGNVHYTAIARLVLGQRLAHALPPPATHPSDYVSLTGPQTFWGSEGSDTMDYDGDDSRYSINDYRSMVLYGLGGNDTIVTGSGSTTAYGGTGDDRLQASFSDDRLFGGDGNDVIMGAYNYANLLGSQSAQTRWEFDRDYIDGGPGDDTLSDMIGDNVVLGGDGRDAIATGGGDDTLYGGDGADLIEAGAGRDKLVGGAGADVMAGGAGSDYYVIDNADDSILELSDEGIDTVYAEIGVTLGANVERLHLAGTANINGTGNALDNVLAGNSGNNRLDGGQGADTMAGDLGDDTYVVEQTDDIAREGINAGNDTVYSSIRLTLGQNIENLILTGAADLNGTGNGQNNVIIGNAGNNILQGLDGNDSIDGGSGGDIMTGGAGNDSYVVEQPTDIVRELAQGGTDTIYSSIGLILAQNVENLILTGGAGLTGTGNALNNVITGDAGNNNLLGLDGDDRIDGGAGSDTMAGGLGNDTFYVDDALDRLIEIRDGGIDTVFSSVTFATRNVFVEVVTLTGTGNINLAGNGVSERLSGNAGKNLISAGSGDDMLDGAAGNDTLTGGLGADTFRFTAGSGVDRIVDFSAAQDDHIDTHAISRGIANGGGVTITQQGSATLINLGVGNVIEVLNTVATSADLLSHIVW